jgi:hypothetical protein
MEENSKSILTINVVIALTFAVCFFFLQSEPKWVVQQIAQEEWKVQAALLVLLFSGGYCALCTQLKVTANCCTQWPHEGS